jgi:hypothetical protein
LRPEDEFSEIQALDGDELASVAAAVTPFFQRG